MCINMCVVHVQTTIKTNQTVCTYLAYTFWISDDTDAKMYTFKKTHHHIRSTNLEIVNVNNNIIKKKAPNESLLHSKHEFNFWKQWFAYNLWNAICSRPLTWLGPPTVLRPASEDTPLRGNCLDQFALGKQMHKPLCDTLFRTVLLNICANRELHVFLRCTFSYAN